jgi:hypothetical protein
MDAATRIKQTIGDMLFQIAALSAENDELKAKLAEMDKEKQSGRERE